MCYDTVVGSLRIRIWFPESGVVVSMVATCGFRPLVHLVIDAHDGVGSSGQCSSRVVDDLIVSLCYTCGVRRRLPVKWTTSLHVLVL